MKTKKSERRVAKRFPIRVLVNCLPPGTPKSRNGHASQGWEMWARDMGENGVRLEWSQAWAMRDYEVDFKALDERPASRKIAVQRPMSILKKGSQVILDGLVYDDGGSKLIRGKVQWAKASKKGESCEFGILVTSPERRSYFKALAA